MHLSIIALGNPHQVKVQQVLCVRMGGKACQLWYGIPINWKVAYHFHRTLGLLNLCYAAYGKYFSSYGHYNIAIFDRDIVELGK